MGHFSWLSYIFKEDATYIHVHHFALTALVVFILGCIVYLRLRHTEQALVPSPKLGVATIFEVATASILNLMEGIIGKDAVKYFPLVGTLFIFIFLNNLLGIFPGFLPPTDNLNTTLAMGVVVFIYFNYVGIREQGLVKYLKHFGGPVIYLAPLMFIIEFIGIAVRPLSLGLRLFGNMTGDHLVLGIFSDLIPLFVPVLFLGLAIFVSFIQAFVFSLLTTIYIGLALPHEEHH
jgi:F-type H+-transporting ATPase subunit a